jgi:hypothetical protein
MTPKPLNFDASGWLEGIDHVPSPNHNDGMTLPMNGVVMHTQVGDHAENFFAQASSQVSAHFCVNITAPVSVQCVSIHAVAWAEVSGNNMWFSIEHGDDQNPARPLTQTQIEASAQIYEALEHYAGFGFESTANIGQKGYTCHYQGGNAWGGHSCPDNPPGGEGPRSHQRPAILAVAKEIRAVRNGKPNPPVKPKPIDPGVKIKDGFYRHEANGTVSLNAYAKGRNVTADQIADVTEDKNCPISPANEKLWVSYRGARGFGPDAKAKASDATMPRGLVFYTSNA